MNVAIGIFLSETKGSKANWRHSGGLPQTDLGDYACPSFSDSLCDMDKSHHLPGPSFLPIKTRRKP